MSRTRTDSETDLQAAARERPLPARPVIGVIGAGAVGTYYGGRLARHGHDVHFHLRADYQAVRTGGLRVRSCEGDFALPPGVVRAYADPREMPKADLVLVTLKTTANDHLAELVGPLVKEETVLLTLQNGLGNEDLLARLFGPEKVLGGMAFVCINRIGPGLVHHIAEGLITLGELTGPPSPRLRQVGRMMQEAGIPIRLLEDLVYGRWEKLLWNMPFNGLSAALDMTTDLLVGSDDGEDLVRGVMEEVIAAARAADGVTLPRELVEAKIRQTQAMGPYRTSMHLDMQAGRPMEVEAIFGEPLRRARAAGLPVPRLAMLYHMLKLVDARGRGGAVPAPASPVG